MQYDPDDFEEETNERIVKALIYGCETLGMIVFLILGYMAVSG